MLCWILEESSQRCDRWKVMGTQALPMLRLPFLREKATLTRKRRKPISIGQILEKYLKFWCLTFYPSCWVRSNPAAFKYFLPHLHAFYVVRVYIYIYTHVCASMYAIVNVCIYQVVLSYGRTFKCHLVL